MIEPYKAYEWVRLEKIGATSLVIFNFNPLDILFNHPILAQ